MYLHKNGVRLRKVGRSDLPDLLEIKSESWWGVHSTPILNADDQERWFESIGHDTLCMIAEWEGANAGFLLVNQIEWIGRIASIGGGVYQQFRGGELSLDLFRAGTDFTFEFLNMHRLNAEVLDTNLAVQKIDIGDLGFTVEGVKRQSVHKCGRYYDSLVLGLLRSEWSRQPRVLAYGGSCNRTWDHETAEKMAKRSRRWRERVTQDSGADAILQPPHNVAASVAGPA